MTDPTIDKNKTIDLFRLSRILSQIILEPLDEIFSVDTQLIFDEETTEWILKVRKVREKPEWSKKGALIRIPHNHLFPEDIGEETTIGYAQRAVAGVVFDLYQYLQPIKELQPYPEVRWPHEY